jgi:galactosylgalactosylxylosylprotein 3-beta-glucuronosyltransferase 3
LFVCPCVLKIARKMNGEITIRVRKKYCLILFFAIAFILFLIASSNSGSKDAGNCERDRTELFTDNDRLPIIYAITPTYSRPVQKAELTR